MTTASAKGFLYLGPVPLCEGRLIQRTSLFLAANLAATLRLCQTSDLQQMPTLGHPGSTRTALHTLADCILQKGSSCKHHDHRWSWQETGFLCIRDMVEERLTGNAHPPPPHPRCFPVGVHEVWTSAPSKQIVHVWVKGSKGPL